MANSVNTNDIIDLLETMKTWASKQGEEALEYAQACVRSRAPEYKYRMVRSHTPNCYKPHDELDKYLASGYEFVRASEFIPLVDGKSGYIEYILRRKKENSQHEDGI